MEGALLAKPAHALIAGVCAPLMACNNRGGCAGFRASLTNVRCLDHAEHDDDRSSLRLMNALLRLTFSFRKVDLAGLRRNVASEYTVRL